MIPGVTKYRHYKGGVYTFVCLARVEATPNKRDVIYKDSEGVFWSRPEVQFFSKVSLGGGDRVDRFTLIEG